MKTPLLMVSAMIVMSLSASTECDLEAKLPEIFKASAAHYEKLMAASEKEQPKPYVDTNGVTRIGRPRFPRNFDRGVLGMVEDTDWTSGFFPGSLWYLYEATGDEKWREAAVKWTDRLEGIKDYPHKHDIGFMMYCSAGNALRITRDPKYESWLHSAAKCLRERFGEKTGTIRSWNNWGEPCGFFGMHYVTIIDNMMNLELLMWDSRWWDRVDGAWWSGQVARKHADTTMKHHFRADGSAYHILDYDPETGKVHGIRAGQGACVEGTWARGQAWAVYGFTMMYRETREAKDVNGYEMMLTRTQGKEYLEQALKAADYVMDAPTPADGIPYWDYKAPNIPNEPRDSSAAAILSSALLELAKYAPSEKASRYRAWAVRALNSLCGEGYFAKPGECADFLLKHGTGVKPFGGEIDTPLNYGDYYFLEALLRFRELRQIDAPMAANAPLKTPWKGRGIEIAGPKSSEVDRFCEFVGSTLAPAGINTIFLSFNYRYQSHPECCGTNDMLDAVQVRKIMSACRKAGIRVIPWGQGVGHLTEYDGVVRGGILAGHPELDEARGAPIDYHYRLLCTRHPGSFKVVSEMLDELAEVCGTDAIHIGCDELTGIGTCERCRGIPKSKLFADWVNSISRHLRKRGVTTCIWGDRLIDHQTSPYDCWESSDSGTADALEMLDRDVVICDWHYSETAPYPSIKRFRDAGFRVWPSVVRFERAARMFVNAAERDGGDSIEGVIFTNWLPCDRLMNAYEGKRFLDFEDPANRGPHVARLAARVFHKFFPGAPHEWDLYEGTEIPTEGRSVAAGKGARTWYDRLVDGTTNDVPAKVRELQCRTSGVSFRFRTDSDRLLVDWTAFDTPLRSLSAAGVVDVYQFDPKTGWRRLEPAQAIELDAEGTRGVWKIAPDRTTVVYAPLGVALRTFTIGVKPGSTMLAAPHISGIVKPVVFYGGAAVAGDGLASPGACPTAVKGRNDDVPVVNLGFPGACGMEDGLLKRIAEIDASAYVLDVADETSLSVLKERAETFIRGLIAKRPDIPVIVVIDEQTKERDRAARNDFMKKLLERLRNEDPKKFAKLATAGLTNLDLGQHP